MIYLLAARLELDELLFVLALALDCALVQQRCCRSYLLWLSYICSYVPMFYTHEENMATVIYNNLLKRHHITPNKTMSPSVLASYHLG
jgi:hypothetical protein